MTRGSALAFRSKGRETVVAAGPVAVLDLGSTKITCLIAEPADRFVQGQDYRNALRVTGIGTTASRGIKGGAISNIDEAERAIRVAVDAAERMAKQSVRSVHVNVSGGKPSSLTVAGHVRTQTGVVSPRDVEHVLSAALATADIGKRHVLHLNPVGYSLDGVAAERPPLGMHGEVLGIEVGIVTLGAAHLRNLSLAVERAHLKVATFALSAYAAGRGTLFNDELSLGTLVIDFGGGTTSYALFRNGNLAASGMVSIGACHVTADVAQGLSTTVAHAERLKTMFGSVLPFALEDREMLAVPLLGERGVDAIQQVPKNVLNGMIFPRIEETIEILREDLSRHVPLEAVSRVVLTGGGAQLQGMRDLVAHYFGCPVRFGQPVMGQGSLESVQQSGFAVGAGLLALSLKPDRHLAMPTEAKERIERQQMGYARRVGRWLKEAL